MLIAIVLDVGARYWPLIMLNVWIRGVLAFFVAWMLFSVVHRAARMAGAVCTVLVILLTAGVFVSQHWVFAEYGVPTSSGRVIIGDGWLDPYAILATNVSVGVALAFAIALCHDGGSIWRTVVDVLSTHVHG